VGQDWANVNLDKGLLTVASEIVVDGWEPVEEDPKTDGSAATIALDDITVEVLREHRVRQQAERTAWNAQAASDRESGKETADWSETGKVFTAPAGGWMHPETVSDEFQRIYGSAGARLAFLSSARNVYLDRPFGRNGFYPRLAGLERPALFVWASHDRVIPAAFSRRVAQWLPSAEQIVVEGCGHVPQIERAEQTNGLLRRFFARVDALDAPALPPARAA
jgi:pimeloyl-ACP methyl ester carboxylesterase